MKKLFLFLLLCSIFTSPDYLRAQSPGIEETKKILCSHKWFLRRFEQDGKMFTVPADLQGLKRVFNPNGTVYEFLPGNKESEATRFKYTITKSTITIDDEYGETIFKYKLEDFIGYHLYLTEEYEDADEPTYVFEQAEKIETTGITKSFSESITIGQQVWATKNIDTDHFSNGDPIAEARTPEEWQRAAKYGNPAWCYAKNDASNGPQYGRLYNWYAVNDLRGLAPNGWHVPTKDEVDALMKFLGGKDEASAKMKTTAYWRDNGGGTNSSGFSAMPGGKRYQNGDFSEFNFGGYFWTTTLNGYEGGKKYAHHFLMQAGKGSLMNGHMALLAYGCSVRCLKN